VFGLSSPRQGGEQSLILLRHINNILVEQICQGLHKKTAMNAEFYERGDKFF